MNILDALRTAWTVGHNSAAPIEHAVAAREADVQRIFATSLDARSLDVTVIEDPDPTALSTALNTLEAAALAGTKLHGDDVHRLRATVDQLTGKPNA